MTLLFLAALLLGLLLRTAQLARSPETAFLRSRGSAEWIRLPAVPDPHHHPTKTRVTRFRTQLDLVETPDTAPIEVLSLRRFELRVNGARIGGSEEHDTPWVDATLFDIAPHLTPGPNVVRLDVSNSKGPPAVRVHGPALGLATDPTWEARESIAPGAHGDWQPAVAARERASFELSGSFPSSAESLGASAGLLLACFAAGFGASLGLGKTGRGAKLDAGALRWLLLVAWGLLCAHNLLRLPLHLGMDAASHYRYVLFVAERGALPFATDGAQMFQPPLFYALAAPVYLALARLLEPDTARMALRCLPMLAGLALVEISYRSAVTLFPGRRDLRLVATTVGGLLPVSLYMAQTVGNEPLSGLLIALLLLVAFRALVEPGPEALPRRALVLGALFGLALLAKVTVLLLAPALALALFWSGGDGPGRLRRNARSLALCGAAAVVVAGWYFARNQLELGVPYVGGWDPNLVADPERDLGWQDPGYRVPGDFLHFGHSLLHPVYASISGFWDGFYSTLWLDGFLSGAALREVAPPWNYRLMLSLALLSLPLAAAIVWGSVRALLGGESRTHAAERFALLCLASFVAAMVHLHLAVPTYSNVKASYTLGLAPCYALLATSGLSGVMRGPVSRALVAGYLTSWGVFVCGAFWG